jgi:hypothetical protein
MMGSRKVAGLTAPGLMCVALDTRIRRLRVSLAQQPDHCEATRASPRRWGLYIFRCRPTAPSPDSRPPDRRLIWKQAPELRLAEALLCPSETRHLRSVCLAGLVRCGRNSWRKSPPGRAEARTVGNQAPRQAALANHQPGIPNISPEIGLLAGASRPVQSSIWQITWRNDAETKTQCKTAKKGD